jgi:hypothetical protein
MNFLISIFKWNSFENTRWKIVRNNLFWFLCNCLHVEKRKSEHASRLRRFEKYVAPLWKKRKTKQPINRTIWLKLSRNGNFRRERKPLWQFRILFMNTLRNNGSCLVESCNNSVIQIFQSYNTWAPAFVTSSYCCVCWRRWRRQVLMSDGRNAVWHPSLVWPP